MTVDKEWYSRGRNIILNAPLHVKGETYIKLPDFNHPLTLMFPVV